MFHPFLPRSSIFVLALMVLVWNTPVAQADLLLNFGSFPNGIGRGISGTNHPLMGFTTYQAFDVDAIWIVDTVGVDGWENDDPNDVGFVGTILADDGTGNAADGSLSFGSATHQLDIFGNSSSWSDVSLPAVLTPGRYWYRMSAGDADYHGASFHGAFGPGSYSIRGSDGARSNSITLALRINGTAVPEPNSIGIFLLIVLAGIGRSRKR